MRRTVLAGVFLVVAASAQDVSPLHPRIFVRHDRATVGQGITVSAMRARAHDGAYAEWSRPASGRGAAAAVALASRYLEDGGADELRAVRDFLAANTFSYAKNDVGGFLAGAEMAIAFDWTYQGLSPGERTVAMENIIATADSSRNFLLKGGPDINHNYTYMALNTVAVCGLVLRGEPGRFGEAALRYLDLARRFIEGPGMVLDTWRAREGAWGEGSHYTFHETLRNLVLLFQAYRSASDIDYFARIHRDYGDFLTQAGRFLIGSTRPDLSFERIGDTSPNRVLPTLTVPVTIEMLASGLGNAEDAARLRSFSETVRQAHGSQAVHPLFGWGMRLFHDPQAPRIPTFATLPLAMRMGSGTFDQIALRNGWTPDSTLITILAGDHFTDHQHFDKGHFLIYHRGGLAVDGGGYDQMYKSGGHWNEYASRTLAHNCMLVYDPEEVLPKGASNDGGQNLLRGKQHHADWSTYLSHRDREGLNTADVLAYEHNQSDRFDYVRVDLTRAYGAKVKAYERQFVYLPDRNFLIVFDRVSAAAASFRKRWLLHFQGPPEIDGKLPEAGVHSFPGASKSVTRQAGGALVVTTLLPQNRSISSVGGASFEYFNSFTGLNYPPSNPAVVAGARESGNWRIEVSPEKPARDDVFLNALQIMDETASRPVEAKAVSGISGVHLLTPSENQVVVFCDRAPPAYRIASSGPARHLLTGLEPDRRIVVEVNGKSLTRGTASRGGTFLFRDAGRGTRRIRIR